jgi:hypothetical protein
LSADRLSPEQAERIRRRANARLRDKPSALAERLGFSDWELAEIEDADWPEWCQSNNFQVGAA